MDHRLQMSGLSADQAAVLMLHRPRRVQQTGSQGEVPESLEEGKTSGTNGFHT